MSKVILYTIVRKSYSLRTVQTATFERDVEVRSALLRTLYFVGGKAGTTNTELPTTMSKMNHPSPPPPPPPPPPSGRRMGTRLLLRVVLPIALGGWGDWRIVVGGAGRASPTLFVPPSSSSRASSSRRRPTSTTAAAIVDRRLPAASPLLRARDSDDDGLDDLPDSDDGGDDDIDTSWGEEGLSALSGKKLGIGGLVSFTPDTIDSIKAEARTKLDAAFDARLADIDDLRAEMEAGADSSRKRRDDAAYLNRVYESQNLMEKIDRLTGNFLESNAAERGGTKQVANADARAGREGRGVDWGSWGESGAGEVAVVVATGGKSGRDWGEAGEGGGGALLGGVDAARWRMRGDCDDDDEDDVAGSAGGGSYAATENRILIVADEKKVGTESFHLFLVVAGRHARTKYRIFLPPSPPAPDDILFSPPTLLLSVPPIPTKIMQRQTENRTRRRLSSWASYRGSSPRRSAAPATRAAAWSSTSDPPSPSPWGGAARGPSSCSRRPSTRPPGRVSSRCWVAC